MAEGETTFSEAIVREVAPAGPVPRPGAEDEGAPATRDEEILESFRRWGYLQADLDWLGRLVPAAHPDLDRQGEAAERGRRWYCGTLAVQFAHIPDPERRRWVQERMEGPPGEVDREAILSRLIRAETFEQVLQSRYIGNKRFSLEGLAALIPLLDEILAGAAEREAKQAVLAMSHRGRLNVMLQTVGKEPVSLFAGFEEVDPRSVLGSGDVKYHLGATGTYDAGGERRLHIHLVSNPSHLEAVDPVAMGRVRAKQVRIGAEGERAVLLVLMHGDAAFAGQGITAESLNLAGLPGYSIGGTVHVVVNNLLGFTTEPWALHSTRFAADVARRLHVPIFHVNAEDPDAVVRAGRLAVAYRYAFGDDVVVDLIGYRRHGHSEIDDPTITQPRLYRTIKDRPPLWKSYAEAAGLEEVAAEQHEKIRAELDAAKKEAEELDRTPALRQLPGYWSAFVGGLYRADYEVETGLPEEEIAALTERIVALPEGFHVHDKVGKLLGQRREMGRGERPVDFGMAEALAFASLVRAGIPVRFSGQDSRRGTFNHRHAVLIDTETEEEHFPLQHVAPGQAAFEIYDSMLSEAAVLGYEYGYSRDYPEALVLWEAQFGDFVNGAQVILDQFLSAGEDKWGLLSGLVILLPHGYEGQGPEHSSGRMERFLQLAAEDNWQVAVPSTAAQYFHLLRRQALRKWRKPLIVFTPKSGLRHPAATSALSSFTRERFLDVLPERQLESAERVLLATGKIGHELRLERQERGDERTAIVSLELLYPFPEAALGAELARFEQARDIRWVQEEPANMGALFFVEPRIERLIGGRHLRTIKRSPSASPATGSAKAHQLEHKTLLALAFA